MKTEIIYFRIIEKINRIILFLQTIVALHAQVTNYVQNHGVIRACW